MSDKEIVVDEGNIFQVGDNYGKILLEEMNDNDFCKAGGDKEPFEVKTVDILSSLASAVGDSTVFSVLKISTLAVWT